MTVQEQIAQSLKPWLDCPNWYTSHDFDEKRFLQAVKAVNDKVGTDWSEQEFQDAVYAVIGQAKKEGFQEYVSRFTSIALYLRDYAKLG